MENAVFLHLIRQGYKVVVGQRGVNEIDFVGERKGKKIYIQVSYLLNDEKTLNREFGNLIRISDSYPKYVVSMDELNAGMDYKGITLIHLGNFLMMEL
jgi:predicted AAA+ superfamily ATPase